MIIIIIINRDADCRRDRLKRLSVHVILRIKNIKYIKVIRDTNATADVNIRIIYSKRNARIILYLLLLLLLFTYTCIVIIYLFEFLFL